jgi:signal transduction histidine kinase
MRLERLERILAVSQELCSTVALEPLLKKIATMAAELTGSEGASILLLDAQTGELRFRAAASEPMDQLANIPVPIEGSIAGAVLTSREPLLVPDVRSDPRHYNEVGQQIGFETRSLLAVPLEFKDRRMGVLEAVNKRDDRGFVQEDVETLTALGVMAVVAIENARLVGALQDAYNRLGELDRLKSDFIAIASHELRTPLSLILGYASVLREQLGDAAGPQLDGVVRAGLRLKHIIETMLNLRYLEAGEVVLACEWFDLRNEVGRVCDAYRPLVEAHGLALELSLPDEPVALWADRSKIGVVLENLLSNAVKFTAQGGRLQVVVAVQGNQVEVAVADTGVGIVPEALEHVFERFYQVEDPMTRRYGGMGLGLSIVKGLVELHGGRVRAESVPDHGSRFAFVLPMKVSPPAEEEPTA